jgi:hypothetical protein
MTDGPATASASAADARAQDADRDEATATTAPTPKAARRPAKPAAGPAASSSKSGSPKSGSSKSGALKSGPAKTDATKTDSAPSDNAKIDSPKAGTTTAKSASPKAGAGKTAGRQGAARTGGTVKSAAGKADAASGSAAEAPQPEGAAAKGRVALVRWTPQLLALALAWLAVLLYGTKVSIDSATAPEEAVDWTSVALPAVVAASVLAAACVGAAAVNIALRRRPALATWARWVSAVGSGAVAGAVVGALIIAQYGHAGAILLLAGAVLVAGALGGVLAGLPARETVVAGLAAGVALFYVEFLLQLFQGPLRRLFGAGNTGVSQWNAGTRLAVTQALIGGLAAGLVAYLYLRRNGRGARMPGYLCAGALPGLLLLIAEAITRIAGKQVFAAVAGLSEGDKVLLDYWKNSRLNQALVVLFVGAIVALICFGRSLPNKRARRRAR